MKLNRLKTVFIKLAIGSFCIFCVFFFLGLCAEPNTGANADQHDYYVVCDLIEKGIIISFFATLATGVIAGALNLFERKSLQY